MLLTVVALLWFRYAAVEFCTLLRETTTVATEITFHSVIHRATYVVVGSSTPFDRATNAAVEGIHPSIHPSVHRIPDLILEVHVSVLC